MVSPKERKTSTTVNVLTKNKNIKSKIKEFLVAKSV